jgi:hypothetical protein
MVSSQPPSLRLTRMKKIEIEGHRCRWRFWMAPDLTPEERGQAGHAISLALIDPPRPQTERRRVAIRAALGPLGPYRCHAAVSRRAAELARCYGEYLGNGWKRERNLANLPEPHSIERLLLHRIARLNNGRPLRWRQLLRIARPL